MIQKETRLDLYDNSWFKPGGSMLKKMLWYFVNAIIINSALFPISSLKVLALKLFGAKIGPGVVIKPNVNIKYPWLLEIGKFSWIGEGVWIDNLAYVKIGNNVCISQGGLILCGNHNYKSERFDLMVKEILLEDGSWVGAKSIVCPGTVIKSHTVLAAGSVCSGILEPYSIYQGNPATKVKIRIIS